jgi:formiminotetrahydrofolate cyclodeaminase
VAFADLPLRDVLDELAAHRPVPGGGASAAWACAIGAGLVEMAAAFGSLDAVGAEARARVRRRSSWPSATATATRPSSRR